MVIYEMCNVIIHCSYYKSGINYEIAGNIKLSSATEQQLYEINLRSCDISRIKLNSSRSSRKMQPSRRQFVKFVRVRIYLRLKVDYIIFRTATPWFITLSEKYASTQLNYA